MVQGGYYDTAQGYAPWQWIPRPYLPYPTLPYAPPAPHCPSCRRCPSCGKSYDTATITWSNTNT